MRYNREEKKLQHQGKSESNGLGEKKRLLLKEDNTCMLGKHYNKEERESNGLGEKNKNIQQKGESVHIPRMCYNRKKKSFNSMER